MNKTSIAIESDGNTSEETLMTQMEHLRLMQSDLEGQIRPVRFLRFRIKTTD